MDISAVPCLKVQKTWCLLQGGGVGGGTNNQPISATGGKDTVTQSCAEPRVNNKNAAAQNRRRSSEIFSISPDTQEKPALPWHHPRVGAEFKMAS